MDGQPQRWLKTHRKRVRASFYPNITVVPNRFVLAVGSPLVNVRCGSVVVLIIVCFASGSVLDVLLLLQAKSAYLHGIPDPIAMHCALVAGVAQRLDARRCRPFALSCTSSRECKGCRRSAGRTGG